MKALVAVTCIAVVVAIGYFFWGEYRDAQALHAAQAIAAEKASADRIAAKKAADDALIADCNKRVPSQTTENLKALYERCLAENGISSPAP